jgi:hypothetical protein
MSEFAEEVSMVQGDDGPSVQLTLRDSNGLNAVPHDPSTWPVIDLTNFNTVATASNKGPTAAETLVVVVVDAPNGVIAISPKGSTMITVPDVYKVEVTLTNTGTSDKQTVNDWLRIVVRPRVA